ncbi:HNH endonuclease [Paenibacillus sp. Sa2BVA9]|uniref:HNH endonuclease n=2 Tax=Paenibacillus gallinarum TaxID=2762232 RepID=A0ABR8T495_9BACL|nr:HNH endonuclease [Paenibacillus gallinarum]
MLSWHGLRAGDTINNDKLCSIFKCAPQGGMRRSLTKNSLIIVSNHVESLYEDRWVDDVLHYTGMGQSGDQSKSFAQNKTLNESNINGVEVYLFEVFKQKEYTYRGRVELAEEAYQENQPDDTGSIRKVWVFPLRVTGEKRHYQPSKELVDKVRQQHEKKAKKMSIKNLEKRAKYPRKTSIVRNVNTITYDRDPYVSEYAKRRAKGKCQLCECPAPFQNRQGDPYLETHHIVWLARGGEDTIYNTVALCPNCHKKMHILDLPTDVHKLTQAALKEGINNEAN